jgi:methionyl-tRNA formyltransferase
MHNHAITAPQRVLYVSGMLLAMQDLADIKKGLVPDDLKGFNLDNHRDGDTIVNQIENYLTLKGIPQDGKAATFYARRAPLDGCIDWSNTAKDIDRLIKASTSPHPGAFSFYGNNKVLVWKSNYYASGLY